MGKQERLERKRRKQQAETQDDIRVPGRTCPRKAQNLVLQQRSQVITGQQGGGAPGGMMTFEGPCVRNCQLFIPVPGAPADGYCADALPGLLAYARLRELGWTPEAAPELDSEPEPDPEPEPQSSILEIP